MASKNADLSVRVTESVALREALPLLGMLALALIIRLFFLPSEGYKNDVQSFESWALTLYDHGVRAFYHSTTFIDYPPGYLWVLGAVGWFYHVLHVSDASAGYYVLRDLVKLPAIIADLGCAALIYALALRFVGRLPALGAAALFAFNPATIYISAYWGQVDAVSALFTLGALLAAFRKQSLWAWALLAIAVLIKPQAVILAPLLFAYDALANDGRARPLRLAGGPLLAVGVGYAIAAPFAPAPWNPVSTLAWLLERYVHGTSVYPYSSINAFNIYAIARPFWQPDSQQILLLPQSLWGILLVVAACAMILWRYVQRRDDRAFLEAALLMSLALFLFATRMHERYVYNAFAMAVLLAPLARRYLLSAVILSITLFANLIYSYDYLGVMQTQPAGVDPTNLMPWLSHPAALLNVLLFAYLSYVYLGTEEQPAAAVAAAGTGTRSTMSQVQTAAAGWERFRTRLRSWFAPLEGTAALTRVDWAIAAGLGVFCFILVMIDIANPKVQIFDEIYYARTAKEYLQHKDVFEWTHPPLTKLLIALGVIINGGYPSGFTSFGWRLASAFMGSLTVPLLYAFAKRLLRSTPFAAIAAGLLFLSGFHYVQSRIGTPEITVAFFSLASLYCAYRYVIASQIRVVERLRAGWQVGFGVGIAASAVTGAIAVWAFGRPPIVYGDGRPDDTAAKIAVFIVFASAAYLVARLALPRLYGSGLRVACYADGSTVEVGQNVRIFPAAESGGGKKSIGYRREGLEATFAPDGSERYRTEEGDATFRSDGTLAIEPGGVRQHARDAALWMWLLTLALACVVDSKWNGFFTLGWVLLGLAVVAAQRWWCRPAQWGNPRIPLDVIYAAILIVGAGIYVLSYIPYFTLGHNLADLMGLQRQMFLYHDELKATHPYQARWWEWPIIWRPISYYYHDFGGAQHIVAEILALPNPVNWWFGLLSVPVMFAIGLIRRHKGFALLIGAYLWQWLPWITSPRITFEYHFFPNLAIICIANALVLHEVWRSWARWGRIAVIAFLAAVAWAFVFWFPIWIGAPIPYDEWRKRMFEWLMGARWI